jgi:hypothetical protein
MNNAWCRADGHTTVALGAPHLIPLKGRCNGRVLFRLFLRPGIEPSLFYTSHYCLVEPALEVGVVALLHPTL